MTAHTTHHTKSADDDTLIATSEGNSEDPPSALTLISIPEGAFCDAQGHCSEQKEGT
jgi:hypothetical protein